jgi:hypothetical protein
LRQLHFVQSIAVGEGAVEDQTLDLFGDDVGPFHVPASDTRHPDMIYRVVIFVYKIVDLDDKLCKCSPVSPV